MHPPRDSGDFAGRLGVEVGVVVPEDVAGFDGSDDLFPLRPVGGNFYLVFIYCFADFFFSFDVMNFPNKKKITNKKLTLSIPSSWNQIMKSTVIPTDFIDFPVFIWVDQVPYKVLDFLIAFINLEAVKKL